MIGEDPFIYSSFVGIEDQYQRHNFVIPAIIKLISLLFSQFSPSGMQK